LSPMPAPYCYAANDLRDANPDAIVQFQENLLYCFSRWDTSASDMFGTYVYEWTAYDGYTGEVMGTGGVEREAPLVRPSARYSGPGFTLPDAPPPPPPEGTPPSTSSGAQQASKAKGFAIATGLTVLGGGLIALLRR
jgi:hypothetical protein